MDNQMNQIAIRLQEPFEPEDLEWRVQRCGLSNNGKPWVAVVAYVTNRAIQQRLDDVLGFAGWQNEYKPSPNGNGFLCGISIRSGSDWITKWDGAENTKVEPLKGGLSGSMKRAAVQLGIGRYLYNLETKFAVCNIIEYRNQSTHNYALHKDKNAGTKTHIDWANPELPGWALPNVDADQYLKEMKVCETLACLKEVFANAYMYAKSFGRIDLQDSFKEAYEEEKNRVDLVAQETIKERLDDLTNHVTRQLQTLSMIPEKSSVSRVCTTIRNHILTQSEGQYYDTSALMAEVDDCERSRLDEMTIKEESTNE